MKFYEDAFEGAVEIVAAAMEEAEVDVDAKGGKQVAAFFTEIYKRLALIEAGKLEFDEDEDEEDEEDEDEEDEDEED
ncbi:MAG: hypothetical protein IJC43_06845, partial [Clostridia bacterium]|nr:hypothetical protein [Clostridia bacterium]